MYLVIDIGNSFTKLAYFTDDKLIKKLQFKNTSTEISSDLKSIESDYYVIISSVSTNVFDFVYSIIKTKTKNILIFSNQTKIPIINKYLTPETLGLDRLAAIIGANTLYPKTDLLVFDAGTALTIDFINKQGEYIGGNISPGINLRYKSLHDNTSKLPLLKKTEKFVELGNSTNEAIISGVQKGILLEVDSYISEFKKNYNNLMVVFTGGDCFFFEKNLKNSIFANQNLVSIGLLEILKFNV